MPVVFIFSLSLHRFGNSKGKGWRSLVPVGGRKTRDHKTIWCLLWVGYRLVSLVSLSLPYFSKIKQESRWALGQGSVNLFWVFCWVFLHKFDHHIGNYETFLFLFFLNQEKYYRSRIYCLKTGLSVWAISISAKNYFLQHFHQFNKFHAWPNAS